MNKPLPASKKAPAKKAPVKAPVKASDPAKVVRRAKEELRVSQSPSGSWYWEMYRGGRFVARSEACTKKGNAQRSAEKFNALLASPMTVVA